MRFPELSDIEEAAGRLKGEAVRTPLIENAALNRLVRGRVYIKPEGLQRTGSFKFRGAWNRISRLDADSAPGGVVAYSSGNHAQGVAAAAQRVGLAAVIVMPSDTPRIKQENTRALGAEVVLYDRATENREAIGRELAETRRAVLVPPYDDFHVISGQGTAGLEMLEDLAPKGLVLSSLLVCCGGGGLVAGMATAFAAKSPSTRVYAVEPEDFDDTRRSLLLGKRERNEPGQRSICDALMAPEPGEITFSINRRLLAGGLSVSDAEVRAAMRFTFRELKLVVEPGGAVALAALLSGQVDAQDRVTGLVLSGANVDPALYSEIIRPA